MFCDLLRGMETVVAALIGGIGGGILSFTANLVVAHLNHKRTLERDELNNESQLRRDEVTWKRSEMMRIYARFIEEASALNRRAVSIKEDDTAERESLTSTLSTLPVHEVRMVASEKVSDLMNKFMMMLIQHIHHRPVNIIERAMKLQSIEHQRLSDALHDLENAMRKDIDAQSAGLTVVSPIPESVQED